MENKKEIFKLLIKEFHQEDLPYVIERELEVPFSPKKPIVIYGPRRSGKSFYFYNLIKKLHLQGISKEKILYLNFEDDRILPLNFKELNLLLEAYFELYPENKQTQVFLFFDEIQNIKDWEIFIRRVYDKERANIFITGSSSKLLSKEIATSLRGRPLTFALYPLNFREFLIFKGVKLEKDLEYTNQRFKIKRLLEEYLEWGSFPEVVLEENLNLKRKILKEYFNSLAYRDLSERFSLENTEFLKELLKFLLTNVTSYFSINSYYKLVKQNFHISRETISNYLSAIQEIDYIILLTQFSYSLKVQKVNLKKIISLDNGLRNIISFRFSKDEGKLAENLVGSYLKRKENSIFYWKDKKEVDFVIKEDNLIAINISYGEKIEKRETEALLEFEQKYKGVKKLLLLTKDLEKEEGKIKFIPLWKWLLEK